MRPGLVLLLSLCLTLTAHAGGNRNEGEAVKVMEGYFHGSVGLNQAVNRIQFLGSERYAATELIHALRRSSEPRQREAYYDFLSQLNLREPELERTFQGALQSSEVGEVMAGARGVGRLKSVGSVPLLVKNLEHPMLGVRRECARALGLIGKPAGGAPLMAAAKKENDLDVKVLMLRSVGLTGDKKQATALEALLKDNSESTRMAAAQGLCALGAPKCAPFARGLLASADKNERLSAVMLFEGTSAKVSSPLLTPVLADKEAKVRARAARILIEGGEATRLDWLVLEASKANADDRLVFEDELERLRVTDEQRQGILKKAGLQ